MQSASQSVVVFMDGRCFAQRCNGCGLLGTGGRSIACSKPANATTTQHRLIMADDLGWKDLHCYGNEKLDTPNLDRLAQQGRLFTDAYSAAAVCTPTRAALMTGEAPERLQITNHAGGHPAGFQLPGTDLATPPWTRHLPLERITLAEQLKSAGYATDFFGKWHLSCLLYTSPSPRDQRGSRMPSSA